MFCMRASVCVRERELTLVCVCLCFDKSANVIKMNKFDPFQTCANNFYTKLAFSEIEILLLMWCDSDMRLECSDVFDKQRTQNKTKREKMRTVCEAWMVRWIY